MQRYLALCVLLWLPMAAQASDSQTWLLGGIPGTEASTVASLTLEIRIPELPHFPTLYTRGTGSIHYYLSGQIARIPCRSLPTLAGTLLLPTGETTVTVTLRGMQQPIAIVSWGSGRDITLKELGLVAEVSTATADPSLFTIPLPNMALTTGTVRVGGTVVRGAIDVGKQRAVLVGTFIMPKTGTPSVDQQIAGTTILLRLTASPQPIDNSLRAL